MDTSAIALVTTNGVHGVRGEGWKDGPAGRKAFIPRNTGSDQASRRDIEDLWARVEEIVPQVARVVVYLDSRWFEETLARVRRFREKTILLTCDCRFSAKQAAIAGHGLSGVPLFTCDCCGRQGMGRAFRAFMERGKFLSQEDLVGV